MLKVKTQQRFGKIWHRCCKNKVLEQFYALLSVCSSGSRYKSPVVLLKVVIIERKSKYLLFSLLVESGEHLVILCLEQDTTIQIQLRFWGNYSCEKIVTTGLLYCVMLCPRSSVVTIAYLQLSMVYLMFTLECKCILTYVHYMSCAGGLFPALASVIALYYRMERLLSS